MDAIFDVIYFILTWLNNIRPRSRRKYFPNGIISIQKDLVYDQPTSEEGYLLKEKIATHLKKE